jgi:rhodanese-related sulfurtransferase
VSAQPQPSGAGVQNIGPADLAAWLADPARQKPLLLDVREPWEFEICRIAGSKPMPLREVPARADELDPGADTVVICHHGGRSLQAALYLARQGFARVWNLAGGVDAWARAVDPAMRRY